MDLFRRHGYDGTSIAALSEAIEVNAPSLYAAFGSKEELFRQAVDFYCDQEATFYPGALAKTTAREVAEAILQGEIDLVTNPRRPHGCLMVQGALATGPAASHLQREMSERRNGAEAMVRTRLERARAEGDLPADADPKTLARYIMTVNSGLAVMAAGGSTRKQLQEVARVALQGWPAKKD